MTSVLAAHSLTVSDTLPPPCGQTLCGAESLRPFFERVRTAGDRPISILQIGDSHTAADAITNALRAELQRRFGNGGRGMMAPGRPYPRVVTWNVTASQSEGWTATGILDAESPSVPIGLTGFTQTARSAGRTLSITADSADHLFHAYRVCAVTAPGAGSVRLTLGNNTVDWSLEGPVGAQCRTLESREPVDQASLTTLTDAPVSIASVATSRAGGGVVLSNLGVIGAQVDHLARAHDGIIDADLASSAPDLIILAFGTNEAFREDLPDQDYDRGLRAQVARLRRLAGSGTPILIVGPPDVARRRAGEAPLACDDGSSTPRALGPVREAQRQLAAEQGYAFWDWERAMGGRCSVRRWLAQDLMRDDLIHFNRYGGDRIGRMLFSDIARAGLAFDPRWGGETLSLPRADEPVAR